MAANGTSGQIMPEVRERLGGGGSEGLYDLKQVKGTI